jgi:rubredoxin
MPCEKLKSKLTYMEMKRYRCPVCGYIYDPATGDPHSDVEPGTAFEDLPSGWACPVCGAPPDEFEEYI